MNELPAAVSLSIGEGGLPTVEISSAKAQATVYLYGANVTSWIPTGHDPVLWLSPDSVFTKGQPIRGGIPVCLPWFSKGPGGDKEPMHGTARLSMWELADATESDGVITLVLHLDDDGWSATYTITVGEGLGLELTTTNNGDDHMVVEEAFHTYFDVQDAEVRVERLLDHHVVVAVVGGGELESEPLADRDGVRGGPPVVVQVQDERDDAVGLGGVRQFPHGQARGAVHRLLVAPGTLGEPGQAHGDAAANRLALGEHRIG